MEGQEKVIAYASGDLSRTDYSQGVSCCCENEIHISPLSLGQVPSPDGPFFITVAVELS